jgi:hypothetical protein
VRVAVLVDGRAGDEVHDEVRAAVRCGAAVEELGDCRMIEMGQNLALGIEVSDGVLALDAPANDLDRDHLAVQVVYSYRLVHGAHAALGDELHDPVRADVGADVKGLGQGSGSNWRRGLDELTGFSVGSEQGFDLGAQFRIPSAGAVEEAGAV